jgi:signal transduction histidine kinase
MRLVLILLFLVVLPTAFLSLIAGHSIQAREVVMRQRLEQNAARRIDVAANQVDELLQADLESVRIAFLDTLLSGTDSGCMEKESQELRADCNFVKDVFLFMNPWNFVFPQAKPTDTSIQSLSTPLLKQELVKQISAMRSVRQSKVSLLYNGNLYCFAAMADFPDLYYGFMIDSEKVADKLKSIMSNASESYIELRIVSFGRGFFPVVPESVLVSDSFNPRPSVLYKSGSGYEVSRGIITSGFLKDPFSHIKVSAVLIDEDEILKAGALERHLIMWGIFLLAVVITTSSVMLILRTVNQASVAGRRSEFVIGMSHDLRTPVASMRILAESLCAGRVKSAKKQKEFVCSIAAECERMGDMIDRLMFFFKHDQGAVSYNMLPLDVSEMVERAVRAVESRSAGKISIDRDFSDDLPCVKGDYDALSKVVTNLLDNALKYGRGRGGQKGHKADPYVGIARKSRRGREWVVISVGDNGIGIEAADQKKIFKRFYRVGGNDSSHIGGIGLGLFLCADIVRAHHGHITVDSAPGEGALFSVWLRVCGGKNARETINGG